VVANRRPKIEVEIQEDQTQVNPESVTLTVGGTVVPAVLSRSGKMTTLSYQPLVNLPPLSMQTVHLTFSDDAGNSVDREWRFATGEAIAETLGAVRGYWTFGDGNLRASIGNDLEFFDDFESGYYVFGTTGSGELADVPGISAEPTKVLGIPGTSDVELERRLGLRMKHGISPNGGGARVNQWTLIMDLLWVDEGRGWGTLLRTHDIEQPIDGDLFWRASDGSYGKGCCSYYDGAPQEPGKYHPSGEWARVVFAVDLASTPRVFAKSINGFKYRDDLMGDADALDSRYALPPEVLLFQDGDDNEQSSVYISAIQIREGRLSDEEIAALGGPSVDGIPTGIGTEPPAPPDSEAPKLSVSRSGGIVMIAWPASVAGFTLEFADDLENPQWSPVQGVLGNQATIPPGNVPRFYRLRN